MSTPANNTDPSDSGWDSFISGLDERLERIGLAWNQAVDSDGDLKSLTLLHHRLSNLSATARGFRLESFGKRVETAEQTLLQWLMSGKPVEAGELERLGPTLDSILQEGVQIARQKAGPGAEVVRGDFNPRLVFVVDDEPEHLRHLSDQLRLFGYQVQGFANLQTMGAALESSRPDALVVDMNPSISDLECIGSIHRIQQRLKRPCPLVFVSNEDAIQIRFAAVQAGAEAFFTTPVRVEHLVERLDTLTARPAEVPLRALIVDDDEAVARLHQDFLVSAGMEVEVLADPVQLLERIAAFDPDLILMDVYMPEYNGVDLVRMVRQHEDFSQIPVVYLSSEKDEKRQIDAIRGGGDDFLSKPVQPSHLISSVLHPARGYRQVREARHHDPLTGLYNHSRIRRELRLALHHRDTSGAPLSLALLAPDDLGRVNRRHGDEAGDQVLRSLAHLLHQHHSPSTPMGRLSGTGFALVLPGMTGSEAEDHLETLLQKLRDISHQENGETFQIAISAGLVSAPPFEGFQTLLQAARDALKQARENGGNRLERLAP